MEMIEMTPVQFSHGQLQAVVCGQCGALVCAVKEAVFVHTEWHSEQAQAERAAVRESEGSKDE